MKLNINSVVALEEMDTYGRRGVKYPFKKKSRDALIKAGYVTPMSDGHIISSAGMHALALWLDVGSPFSEHYTERLKRLSGKR